MKLKFYTALILLIGAIGLQSCDDDNTSVPAELRKAFSDKYPSASRVEWEAVGGYYVADFYNSGSEASAWFTPNGIWCMTETDLSYLALPEVVRLAFQQSDYATWAVDDIDKLERPNMETIYVIEVQRELQGMEEEMDLYYSEDGLLIKAVADGNYNDYQDYLPTQIPENIQSFLNEKYPNARLIEIETEQGITEVEIIHNNLIKDVFFNNVPNWLYTTWDIGRDELPAVITGALAGSQYSAYIIDDIDYFETPQGDYYELELEQGSRDVIVKINLSGEFI